MNAGAFHNPFTDLNLDPALAEAVVGVESDQWIEGILRLEDPADIPAEFTVVCRFERIFTGRFLASHVWTIRRHSNVISLKAARPVGISEESEDLTESREDAEVPARSVAPFTGLGCIVAALDFGLDFAHPNFLNFDGTTRLVAFWHQGAKYDTARPNRYGYGRTFSPAEINDALHADDPYTALGYHPGISDTGSGSHGTHTMDIAAGNGRVGVASAASHAELMFVHLSTPRTGHVGDLGDSVRMLEALDYVSRMAQGRPWVVNLSVGRTAGSHDGTSLVEQGMHECLRMGDGRAIVQSAGNYRAADLAVEGWLRDGEFRDLEWIIDPADTTDNEIDVWYSGKDRFVIAIQSPQSSTFVEVKLGGVADIVHKGTVVGRIYHRKNDPNNRDNHAEVFLYPGAPSGTWTVRLVGEYVISGRFHAWIERDLARPGAQSRFDPKVTSESYTLGTIATSPLVITVGAYNANVTGAPLAPFSSRGPTRDERRDKPELLAPGVEVLAARSIPRVASRQRGLLVSRSGTSMAAPHVAGAVAAMFEAAGRSISIDEIRNCLRLSAEPLADAEHGGCWGRLNAAEAIRLVRAGPSTDFASVRRISSGRLTASAPGEEPSMNLDEVAVDATDDEGPLLMNAESVDDLLDRAELALRCSKGNRRESEIAFVQHLLGELGDQWSGGGISPAQLFRSVVREDSQIPGVRDLLRVIGTPSKRAVDTLQPGDWMVRAVPGTGDIGHVSVLAFGELMSRYQLKAEGIPAESFQPGSYGIVIEGGAYPHSRREPFARRFLDSSGRVPPHTVILRPGLAEFDTANEYADASWLKVQHRSRSNPGQPPGELEEKAPGPTQTRCVFHGPNKVVVDEATLRNAIAGAATSERAAWLSGGVLLEEDKPSVFPNLVRYWLAGMNSALPPDTLQALQSAALSAPPGTYSNVLDATLNKAILDFNALDAQSDTAVDVVYTKSDDVDAVERSLVPLKTAVKNAEEKISDSKKVLDQTKKAEADARKAKPFIQADLNAATKARETAQLVHETNGDAGDAAKARLDNAKKDLAKKETELTKARAAATKARGLTEKQREIERNRWSAADRIKVRKDVIKRASVTSNEIGDFIDLALLAAHNSRADVEAWSAAFVSSCVRDAAIGLGLEVTSGGTHVGKDKLLKASRNHSGYIIDARNNPAPGRYQAFDPAIRAIAAGDIVCTDRQVRIEAAQRQTLKGLKSGPILHGDIVVEVQMNSSNPYAETIGGNVMHSARKRRYPLDSSGKLIVSETVLFDQEDNSGKFNWPLPHLANKPTLVHRRSAFRIFALLSPVGVCIASAPGSEDANEYADPSWLKVQQRSSNSGQSPDVNLRASEASEGDPTSNKRDDAACPWWMAADSSADYFSYAQPQTWGSARLLINGRSSGGAGANDDRSEPFDMMQFNVESTNPGDAVYLAAWMFDPTTKLTRKSAKAITWGDLIAGKARSGVTFRFLLNDFPFKKWSSNLKGLDALVLKLPQDRRDYVKYVLSRHPAHISLSPREAVLFSRLSGESVPAGDLHVAAHHQKFMVVRHADRLTAFCGGVDIIPGMTPAKWSTTPWHGWHDLQVQLEGPITRDLEKEFVSRWNRERGASRRPPLPGWRPHETLALTSLSKAEQIPGVYRTAVQMLRTVSESTGNTLDAFATPRRDDVRQAYQHGIACAYDFLYLENQYFRVPEFADWIVARGAERPGLIVIIVVVHSSLAEADDGPGQITNHGFFLQHETFDRIVTGLGVDRVRFYEMHKRYVHSKLIFADDRWCCIGSANVNRRGFELDSELNVQIREPDPEVLTGFRKKLWAHNLGVSEAEAGAWAVSDYIAQWDRVAAANAGKARDTMVGEGILRFDYKKFPGKQLPIDPGPLANLGTSGGGSRPVRLA